MPEAKERPILMSAPMVIATLDDRKSQTRRIVSWPIMSKSDGAKKRIFLKEDIDLVNTLLKEKHRDPIRVPSCKYGRIGERLWVRETWEHRSYGAIDDVELRYVADEHTEYRRVADIDRKYRTASFNKRVSIFMPRWASRITLEITDVRVERLQDISEDDAIAEGIEAHEIQVAPGNFTYRNYSNDEWCVSPILSYKTLWEKINGAGSWDINPFVWAISFRKI